MKDHSDNPVLSRKQIEKYIGIPHKFNGDTFEGCDCIGLVRLIYKTEGWNLPLWDGKQPITQENYSSLESWKRLLFYLRQRMTETKNIEKLEPGAVVMFNINHGLHLGVYIGNGDMLAMQVPCIEGRTRSTIYRKKIWKQAFRRGFNRC